MSRNLVVDTSVALKWFFEDKAGEAKADLAFDILTKFKAGELELVAPVRFLAEVYAVLAREAPSLMCVSLVDLLELSINTPNEPSVMERAMLLSSEHGHHFFPYALPRRRPRGWQWHAEHCRSAVLEKARDVGYIESLDRWDELQLAWQRRSEDRRPDSRPAGNFFTQGVNHGKNHGGGVLRVRCAVGHRRH